MSISVMHKPAILLGTGSGHTHVDDPEAFKLLTNSFSSMVIPSDIGILNTMRSWALINMTNVRAIDFNNADIIPQHCCESNYNLRSVIANNVFSLESRAFFHCPQLESVELDKVITIRDYAFCNCYKLSSVNFLSNVFTIGEGAFGNCSALESVELGEITIAMSGAFSNCSSLKNCELYLPYQYGAAQVFYSCSALESVKFNAPMTLGSGFFNGCYNLSSIINTDLIKNASASAFQDCSALTSLFVPGLNFIPNFGFWRCRNLREITCCPWQLTQACFSECNSLESIYLLVCSVPVLAASASNIFFGTPITDSSYLGHYGSIYVPSSWVASYKANPYWSFISDRITSLPASFDSRFVYAYEFYGRSDLTQIPNEKLNVQYVCASAFYNCKITNAELPNVKIIGNYAFQNCTSLTSLSIENCQHCLDGAFQNCTSIAYIYGPSLKTFMQAFTGTNAGRNLSNLVAPNCKYISIALSTSKLTNLDFPEALSVYLNLSSMRSSITSFNVSKAKYIGISHHTLSSIYLPSAVIVGHLNGPNLEYADLPEAIALTGPTFVNCYNLRSVSIPKVKMLGMQVFYSCSLLSKINVEQVYYIDQNAFAGCVGLSEVNIKKLEALRGGVFYGCYNIEKILTCNLSLITFATDPFGNCTSLESLYLLKNGVCSLNAVTANMSLFLTTTPIGNSSYLGHYGSIYVPSRLLSWYRTHSQWSRFSDRFVGLTDQEIDDVINNW